MKQAVHTLILVLLFGCRSAIDGIIDEPPAIIPAPQLVAMRAGHYTLESKVDIVALSKEAKQNATFLMEYLTAIGIESKMQKMPQEQAIRLIISDEIDTGSEGYQMTIDTDGVSIAATTKAGLFYGVQSLIQVIANAKENMLPHLSIKDQPRFSYRGMHLDVGRHMFPVDFIKKYIDNMAHFKYNTFHWHLTEDQGWRIEIKKYPKLQEIAAYRKETVIGRQTTKTRHLAVYDSIQYGGFYTQDEVKEVVAYAAARNISVIPEIELPGHATAALAAYPYLGCTGGPYETATSWGIFEDIYCVGQESTFEFLEDVIDEIIPLFPSQYIHIGGDEARKTNWETCPHCQKRMKQNGLKDEKELQSYFIQRMEKYIRSKGKTIIGWDEILEGGLAKNAVVMSWRGEEGGIAAAQSNHQVIMTPVDWCYFDYYQADSRDEPLAVGFLTTVEDVYGYEPIPSQLTEDQANLVLGSQCNLWSEYIKTGDYAEYMMYPRALAMSEVLWSPVERKNYQRFVNDATSLRPLLDHWKINYAKHIFTTKQ